MTEQTYQRFSLAIVKHINAISERGDSSFALKFLESQNFNPMLNKALKIDIESNSNIFSKQKKRSKTIPFQGKERIFSSTNQFNRASRIKRTVNI
jgi:hypothetical protein